MKSALEWTCLLLSLSLIVQTLEYWSLRHWFSENGVWKWSELREEFSFLRLFDSLLSDKTFLCLLFFRLVASIALLFSVTFPLVLFLLFSSLLIATRFRGSFNGGSDYMTIIVLFALSVGLFFQTEKALSGALWYIALQSILSYFLAGFVKLKQPLWRKGEALRAFLQSPNYNPPELVVHFLKGDKALWAAWCIMLAEVFFPMVLLLPKSAVLLVLSGAFLFHLNNVWLFGLNRFLLAWTATYPAIYFVATYFPAKIFSNSP